MSFIETKNSLQKINGVLLRKDADSVIVSNHISNQLAGSRGLTHSPGLSATALSQPYTLRKMLAHTGMHMHTHMYLHTPPP